MEIQFCLDEGAFEPTKAHKSDAGFDLRTPKNTYVAPQGWMIIDTGVHMLIPDGFCGVLISKSGLNIKHGLRGEGLIDAGYTGSIVVKLYNDTDNLHSFNRGDKIIQLVIFPIPDVELVKKDNFDGIVTERRDKGFGSTGR